MRDLRTLDVYRDLRRELWFYGGLGDHETGCFMIPRGGVTLCVVAASGEGWDHVSVSTQRRTPTWDEMEYVKRLFFRDDETAMQLHVPPADHRNHHPYCLHMWRPLDRAIPRPPAEMVAPEEKVSG